MARGYHATGDIPATVPIFPLSGALLLPRGHLPLNVFEPRYLNMVDMALAGPRLIGMIQPTVNENTVDTPPLSAIGCLGRIVQFGETEDGHYLITLAGICRFRVVEELHAITPYRQIRSDYASFARDLVEPGDMDLPRERLIAALKDYLARRDMNADWSSVVNAPPEMLVNALAMLCPFEPAEKQALLEAPGWQERVDTLIALLEFAGAEAPGGNRVN